MWRVSIIFVAASLLAIALLLTNVVDTYSSAGDAAVAVWFFAALLAVPTGIAALVGGKRGRDSRAVWLGRVGLVFGVLEIAFWVLFAMALLS